MTCSPGCGARFDPPGLRPIHSRGCPLRPVDPESLKPPCRTCYYGRSVTGPEGFAVPCPDVTCPHKRKDSSHG